MTTLVTDRARTNRGRRATERREGEPEPGCQSEPVGRKPMGPRLRVSCLFNMGVISPLLVD